MIWRWWFNSVYVVSYRSAFDDVKVLGIFSNFERAASIVDRLIQFREIRNSECIVIHRTVLNCATYEGLKEQCMVVNQYATTFSRGRYESIYSKVQKEHKRRSVEL